MVKAKMTKAEKRILIAKDVIRQIKAKRIIPKVCIYVQLEKGLKYSDCGNQLQPKLKAIKFGLVIKDAKRPIRIRVKEVDIKKAVCRDHQKCVIANAIRRSRKCDFVDVGVDRIIIGKNKVGTRYMLDSLGKDIVKYFDTHEGAAGPTALTIKPYPIYKQSGNRHKRKPHPGGHRKRYSKPTR